MKVLFHEFKGDGKKVVLVFSLVWTRLESMIYIFASLGFISSKHPAPLQAWTAKELIKACVGATSI